MSGSITKQIIAKGNKNPDIVTTDDKVKAEKELTTEDKVRLGAAGLLMDFADEGEAFFESLFGDDDDKSTFSERYAKNLKENQKASISVFAVGDSSSTCFNNINDFSALVIF